MQTLTNNKPQTAEVALRSFHSAIDNKNEVIPFDTELFFTKGEAGRTQGYIFHEMDLECEVKSWLHTRVNFETVMARYKKYDQNLESLEWPAHYATRFINVSGQAAKCENIFMFFPQVLGITSDKMEDYFGFEFIDIWVSVFDEIVFPCMRRVLDQESQFELFSKLRPSLEKTIYLASVFHEVGHRCGYWKVSPTIDHRISINQFHTDVLGELATDTLLVNLLEEFPEVKYFIFLQRLFWFGRFGFKGNQSSGYLNTDNDTWIGAYLWNQYLSNGVLIKNKDDSWHVNFENLQNVFERVQEDTDKLGSALIEADENTHDELVSHWMKERVAQEKDAFCYPVGMKKALENCLDIVEKPVAKY